MNNDTSVTIANGDNKNKIWLKKNAAGNYSGYYSNDYKIADTNEIIVGLSKKVESLEAKVADLEERLDRKEYIIPPDIKPDKPYRLSQDEFIALLKDGKYDRKYIGTIVTLNMSKLTSNSAKENCIQSTEWMIIDMDHDIKEYRGTYYYINHYYDLIAIRGMRKYIFDEYGPGWIGSDISNYLNDTFKNSFPGYLKENMRLIKYRSEDEWYSDYVILPSLTELGILTADGEFDKEGTAYPDNLRLFTRELEAGSTYWTRTKRTNEGELSSVYAISSKGDLKGMSNIASNYILPIVRFA